MNSVKRAECDCCGYETEVTEVEVGVTEKGTRWYCDLCGGTLASVWARHHHPNAPILRALCFIGNTLRDELRR